MYVLRFGNKLNEEVRRGFIFANLFNSLYLLVRLWWNILVANLATNFQDLVAKVKNLVALAPVLGAISRPALRATWAPYNDDNKWKAMVQLLTFRFFQLAYVSRRELHVSQYEEIYSKTIQRRQKWRANTRHANIITVWSGLQLTSYIYAN